MDILPVTNEQKALLADLSRQTFVDTFASYNKAEDMQLFLDTQFTREQLMEEPDEPHNYFFIAWEDGEPLGYMRLKLWQSQAYSCLPSAPTLEITRLYATQLAIGKGVGKAMMQFALDFARSKMVKQVWLGVWEHNERAIRFYQKWGFERKGDHPFLLGTDLQTDWLMAKELGDLVKI
jgi:ribosomal protein S18 acetylase RimI-like enzyme